MNVSLKYFALLILASLMSCEDIPQFNPEETVPVVEGFIYTGQPVDNIIIKEVQPFGSDEGTEVFLSGLTPTIVWNDDFYQLLESQSLPGRYFYPGNELNVRVGDTYRLQFDLGETRVEGTTTVPVPPESLSISQSTISLPQIIDRRDLFAFFQENQIQVLIEWDNQIGGFYYLVIENIESNPSPLDPNEVLPFNFEFTSEPTQNDFFALQPFLHYNQFGRHRVILYHVNDEYALLYQSLNQDSRDLNEPFTNISNGVGVFSAFSSDTVFFEIVRQ